MRTIVMEDMFWKKKGAWERLAKKNPKEIREKAGMILQDALDWIHVKREETDLTMLERQKKAVALWNKSYDSINHQSCKVTDFQSRHPEQGVYLAGKHIMPMLAGLVSEERLPYVYDVLALLIQATEQCGGWTEENMVFMLLGIPVTFTVFESRDKKPFNPEVYKDEEENRGYRRRSRTFIKNKKMDLVWNGNLVMMMPNGKRINLKFSGDEPVKNAPAMAALLFQTLWDFALEEMLAKREYEKQRRRKRRHDVLHNHETTRLELLHQMMDNYEKAEKLRRVTELMKKQKYSEKMIQKSMEEANRLDPFLTQSEDMVAFLQLQDPPKGIPLAVLSANNETEEDELDMLLLISHEEAVARNIRTFANMAMRRKICNSKWLKWALQKADWYDPEVREKDPVLGVRKLGDPLVPNLVTAITMAEMDEVMSLGFTKMESS